MLMRGSKLMREIWGVVIAVLAILLVISLVSHDPSDRSFNTPSGSINTSNWGGVVGAYLADFLLQGLGLATYLLPLFLFAGSYHLFRENPKGLQLPKAIGTVLFLWSGTIFLSLLRESETAREAGGIVGGYSQEVLISLLGYGGTILIALSLLVLAMMLVSQISLVSTLEVILRNAKELFLQARQRTIPPPQGAKRKVKGGE